jgi:transposase
MKRNEAQAEQVISRLPEADAVLAAGKSSGQVARALEISEQTFLRWRNRYGKTKVPEARRRKELKQENTRLMPIHGPACEDPVPGA